MGAGQRSLLGRDVELAALNAALDRARTGHREVVLITGEGGIGKTSLATALADSARRGGVQPVWGRCWEAGGAPVLGPWRQILRQLLQLFGQEIVLPADVRSELESLMATAGPGLSDGGTPSAEGRFRFFVAAAELLRACAEVRPLVLVLDDLHGADEATVLLLEFVAREVVEVPLLLIGSYRDAEARRQPSTADPLDRIAQLGTLLVLDGLSESDVVTMVEERTGAPTDGPVARRMLEATAGNPFFLGELLSRGATDEAVPQAVRAAIRRRLDPLPDAVRDLLGATAVIGRAADARTLADILGWAPEDVLARLDLAHREGVLVLALDAQGGSAFRHALMQETVYADLSSLERCELHLRVGHALADRPDLVNERAAEVAHHLVRALPLGDVAQAAAACALAAERALVSFGFQEAADLYADAVRLDVSADPEHHSSLLLAHGNALLVASRIPEAQKAFLRAAEVGRYHHLPEVLAHAALGYGGLWFQSEVDDTFRGLLEEATTALGDRNPALRAQLLARTSQSLFYDAEAQPQMREMASESLEIARDIGDPETLTYALTAVRMSRTGPEFHLGRPGLTAELIPLADATGNYHFAMRARHWRIVENLEIGEIAVADRFIAESTRLSEQLGHPLLLGWNRRTRAGRELLRGRYDEADRLMHEALDAARRGGDPRVLDQYGVQLSTLRRDQGRMSELMPVLDSLVEASPYSASWRAARALAYVDLGNLDAAREDFEVVARSGFGSVARDSWLITIALLSETAASIGDAVRARELYDLLMPYADLAVVVGLADACYGAACRMLGRLAATFGDAAAAESHLAQAVSMNRAMGADPYLARSQVDLAEHLLSLDVTVARDEAVALLDEAEAIAGAIGMQGLDARLQQVRLLVQPTERVAEAVAFVEADVALRPAVGGGTVIDFAASRASRFAAGGLGRPTPPTQPTPPTLPAVLTLVLVDIARESQLIEVLGDDGWRDLCELVHAAVREHLSSYDGHALGRHGDQLHLGFAGARAAVHFARHAQREVARFNRSRLTPVVVRIGVHSGEVLVDGDGVSGRHLHLAAGICAVSESGEVLVSAVTRELVQGDPALGFAQPRSVVLPGVDEPQLVYPLGST